MFRDVASGYHNRSHWCLPAGFSRLHSIRLPFSALPILITLYVVENTSAEDYGPAFSAATLAFGVAQVISPIIGGLIVDGSGSFLGVFILSGG